MKVRSILNVMMVLPLAACGIESATQLTETPETQTTEIDQVKLNNEFALDLYKRLTKEGENTFLAPYSVSSALAMAYAGAQGPTAKAMEKALRFAGQEVTHAAFKDLNNKLSSSESTHGYQLNIANRLWGEKTHPFKTEYLNLISANYSAGLQPMDFKNQPNESRWEINKWVEENTNNKIIDLLPQGSIKNNSRLVLTNAVYFNGLWQQKFNKDLTNENGKFTGELSTAKVPLMSETRYFAYAEDEDLNAQVIQLPYESKMEGSSVSMYIVLPKPGAIAQLESKLTAASLDRAIKNLLRAEVHVVLPRFKVEGSYDMGSVLSDLGMAVAFDPDFANFSGIADTSIENLSISKVIHKTFVNVYEGGTEAAGATAVVIIGTTSVRPPPKLFQADHPFIYVIRDDATGSILFIGRFVG